MALDEDGLLDDYTSHYFTAILLGFETQRKQKNHKCTETYPRRIIHAIIRYSILCIITLIFIADFGEFVMHSDDLSESLGKLTTGVHGRQSPIITTLSYLTTQITLAAFTGTLWTLFWKSPRILTAIEKARGLERTMSNSILVDSYCSVSLRKALARSKRRCILTVRAVFLYITLAVLLKLIYTVVGYSLYFSWRLSSYFIFRLPRLLIIPLLTSTTLIGQLIMLFVYFLYAHLLTQYIYCAQLFNHTLQAAALPLPINDKRGKIPFIIDGQCIGQTVAVQSRASSFKTLIGKLSCLEDDLIKALDHMSKAFSPVIISLILGNLAILASRTSSCFIDTGGGPVKTVDTIASISYPLILLGLLLYFAAELHETNCTAITRWRRLIELRQSSRTDQERELWKRSEEDAFLLVRLKITQFREHALTLFETAAFDRRFGIKLVTAFLGFVCFVIERSESYDPAPQLPPLTNKPDNFNLGLNKTSIA